MQTSLNSVKKAWLRNVHLVQFLEGCQQNVYSGGSTPSDNQIRWGGGGHPDPVIRGGGRLKKNFLRPGGGAHPSPGSATGLIVNLQSLTVASTDHKQGRKYEYLILLKILS